MHTVVPPLVHVIIFTQVSSKILMSENYDMNQRGDHSMHVGDPLVLQKIQKLKTFS